MNELKRKWISFQANFNPSTVRKIFALLFLLLAFIRLFVGDTKDAMFVVIFIVLAAFLAHEATKLMGMIALSLGALGSVLFLVYAAFKAYPFQAGIVIFGFLVVNSIVNQKN